jgi:hypothetical protein
MAYDSGTSDARQATPARNVFVTIDRMFFGYMAVVGISAGAILVALPSAGDSWFKPYFWVLLAVALFDGVALLRRQPGTALSIEARLLGFVIGIVLMVSVPTLAGSSARFF